MTQALSQNTQAILLLTAPLIAGRGASQTSELLTPGEYKRLARHLRELHRQPFELINTDASDLIQACNSVIDSQRLQRLLGRGFLLSQVIQHWQTRAIWVVSRADTNYPKILKARMREDAPAVIYGCGDIRLLDSGGLAVVGSRDVDDFLIEYTMAIGKLSARAGRTIISGGAKGIDQSSMRGALEAGGKVIGVLSDNLEKTSMNRDHRNMLLDGQLVLVSPYDPNAGFNVGNAMQRNKLIYAFSTVSLVVNSDLEKGGTWAGAAEQLDKLKFVPVFVRSTGKTFAALDALLKKGALPWPNPADVDSFEDLFNQLPQTTKNSQQADLLLSSNEESSSEEVKLEVTSKVDDLSGHSSKIGIDAKYKVREAVNDLHVVKSKQTVASPETLFETKRGEILQLLRFPKKDTEVAAALNVSKTQAKTWLLYLVNEGVLEKKTKPVCYVVKIDKQLGLL